MRGEGCFGSSMLETALPYLLRKGSAAEPQWRAIPFRMRSIVFGALYILSSYIQGISFEQIPLLNIVPFAVTILVLIATSIVGHREMQPPASLGLSYFREDR